MDFLVELAQFAPYLIPAILVVWFVLVMRRDECAEREKRDDQWRGFLAHQSEGTLKALDAITLNLRELSEQLKAVNARTERIESVLEDHDRHAEIVAQKQVEIAAVATALPASRKRATSS